MNCLLTNETISWWSSDPSRSDSAHLLLFWKWEHLWPCGRLFQRKATPLRSFLWHVMQRRTQRGVANLTRMFEPVLVKTTLVSSLLLAHHTEVSNVVSVTEWAVKIYLENNHVELHLCCLKIDFRLKCQNSSRTKWKWVSTNPIVSRNVLSTSSPCHSTSDIWWDMMPNRKTTNFSVAWRTKTHWSWICAAESLHLRTNRSSFSCVLCCLIGGPCSCKGPYTSRSPHLLYQESCNLVKRSTKQPRLSLFFWFPCHSFALTNCSVCVWCGVPVPLSQRTWTLSRWVADEEGLSKVKLEIRWVFEFRRQHVS